jgi:hypothetical protein
MSQASPTCPPEISSNLTHVPEASPSRRRSPLNRCSPKRRCTPPAPIGPRVGAVGGDPVSGPATLPVLAADSSPHPTDPSSLHSRAGSVGPPVESLKLLCRAGRATQALDQRTGHRGTKVSLLSPNQVTPKSSPSDPQRDRTAFYTTVSDLDHCLSRFRRRPPIDEDVEPVRIRESESAGKRCHRRTTIVAGGSTMK